MLSLLTSLIASTLGAFHYSLRFVSMNESRVVPSFSGHHCALPEQGSSSDDVR